MAKPHRWTRAQLARLGKVYDRVLAAEIGVGADTVREERNRRGIKPLRVTAAKHREVDRLVGKLPDVEIAERLKRVGRESLRTRPDLR